jgi:glycosyltransferase involved in cell wall biosynthesis
MFSWLSVLERKNPQGVIDAFTRAFDPEDGAHLVIKSHGEVRGDARSERLRLRSSRPDIHFVDGHVRQSEVWAMFDACDCYISLHRSEGFGLTMAEAMAAGRPVIATAWSGNLDFMDERTSYLVPAAVTAIPGDVPVYGGLGQWAEPDVEAAAAALRRVHDDPAGAQAVGRRARSHIERTRSTQASGAVLAKYLEDLHARAR